MSRRVLFHRVSAITDRHTASVFVRIIAVFSFVAVTLQSAEALAQSGVPPMPPTRVRIVGAEEPPPVASGPTTPRAIPGTIQAESFDNGANGSAYWDSSAGNSGGQYRTTDVDIEACNEG